MKRWVKEASGRLTARNVPGRKPIVSVARTFIEELSRLLETEMTRITALSLTPLLAIPMLRSRSLLALKLLTFRNNISLATQSGF